MLSGQDSRSALDLKGSIFDFMWMNLCLHFKLKEISRKVCGREKIACIFVLTNVVANRRLSASEHKRSLFLFGDKTLYNDTVDDVIFLIISSILSVGEEGLSSLT